MARILVITPDAETRLEIEPALNAEGHSIRIVVTAGDAIDLLADDRFDVVLCDSELPDVRSHVMMRHIKEMYGIPTIALGDNSAFHHTWLSFRSRVHAGLIDRSRLMRQVHRYV